MVSVGAILLSVRLRSEFLQVVVAFAVLFASAGLIHAQTLEWDPRLVRGELPNGLRYFIHDSGNPADPFNIRLIVGAGSVDEDRPSGIAHMIEHMVFQSTASHPETVHRYLDTIGWRTGREINAMTRETETQFMIRTRPRDTVSMDAALALLADMVLRPRFDPQDWQKEQRVILEEWRRGEGPAERINRQKKAVLRAGSRYVDRPTIGRRETIEATTVGDMRDFYSRYYMASNMVLIVSGAVDAPSVQAAIERHFGDAPAKPKPARPYLAFPLKEGLSGGVVQDEKGTTSQVTYAFRLPMPDRDTDEGAMAYLEKYLLNRLVRQQVERLAPAYAARLDGLSFVMQEPTEKRLILALNGRTRDHAAAAGILLEVAERLRRSGISQADFDTAIAAARDANARNVAAAEARSFAEWEDRITSTVLQGGVLSDPTARMQLTGKLLDQITLQSLNERLATMLAAPDQVLVYQVAGDQPARQPDLAALQAERERLAHVAELAPLVTPETPSAETELPLPVWPQDGAPLASGGAIEAVRDAASAITEWHLSNGDRVVWLERETADGKIYVSGRSAVGFRNREFGSLRSQAGLQLWTQSGFRFWSQAQYDRWRGSQAPAWSWALHDGGLDAGVVVSPEKLPDLMKVYAATVDHGLVRDEALETYEAAQGRHLERAQDFAELVYGEAATDDPGAQAATREELEAAALALLRQPVTWFAVGPRPAPQVLERAFGLAAGVVRQGSLTATPLMQRSGVHWHSVTSEGEDRALVRMSFSSQLAWTPEAAFIISALTQPTQQALKAELRHRLGGVYSVNFELKLDQDTDRVTGELSFSCAPERAGELSLAAVETLRRMPQMIAGADIERMRADIDAAEQVRKNDPATLLRRLALSYRRYDDAGYLQRVGGLSGTLTAKRLSRQAADIFALNDLAVLVAAPAAPD
nr:pitrilysin family protein [Rhizobium sp. CSW-27]